MNKSIYRILLILLTIGLISLLFPRGQRINISCEVGKVWDKDDFHSPFDFETEISEKELEAAQKKIASNFPIVLQKTTVDQLRLSKKLIELNPEWSDYQNDVLNILNKNYKKYIINNAISANAKYAVFENEALSNIEANQLIDRSELVALVSKDLESRGILSLENKDSDWKQRLAPNAKIDKDTRNTLLDQAYDKIDTKGNQFYKGQVLLRKGDIVTKEQSEVVKDLRRAASSSSISNSSNYLFRFIGYFLLTVLIIGVLVLYVKNYFAEIFDNLRSLSFVLIWPLFFSILVYAVSKNVALNYYLIPFCIAPIVIKNFYSDRLAIFIHIVVILIASYLSKQGYEFTFLHILAGIVAVLFVSESRFINKFFISILFIFISYMITYLGLSIINSAAIEQSELSSFLWLTINCILLLIAYPLIPLVEKAFGFTSILTLSELADMNNPLLKEMSLKAPGTLQHSLQVANLSEAAADKIGANSQLVKTAALYHDIGKMQKPNFFIENSSGTNPHEALNDNFESAKIIIDHILEGEKMARKARLPKPIIDILRSHHGNTRVEYFYRKQLSAEPNREFDESLFRYPGPKPVTKEEAIVMLADTIEAASKSLKNPTGQDIDKLVDQLVESKIKDGQLEKSNLSFSELEVCLDVFKSLLRSIYHVRIEYPDQNKSKTG